MSVVPRLRNADEPTINVSVLPHLKNVYFTSKRRIFICLYRHTDLVRHYLDNTLKIVSTSYFRKEQYIFKKHCFFSPQKKGIIVEELPFLSFLAFSFFVLFCFV